MAESVTTTYNGTVKSIHTANYAAATRAPETSGQTFNPAISSMNEVGGSTFQIPSTPHSAFVPGFVGHVTEIVVRLADGTNSRQTFSTGNAFTGTDSLDISASDSGAGSGFSHNVTISLKKGGSAFLSAAVVQTNGPWTQDYVLEIKTLP